jgi:eukaryotic-like serine/threonine-protein kinase
MTWILGKQLQGGKYTIDKELGEGEFGITYRARDHNGRYVAIKTLNETEV